MPSAGQDLEKFEHSHVASRNVKWCSSSRKPLAVSQIVKHRVAIWCNKFIRKYNPRELKTYSCKTCIWMFMVVLFIIVKK